MSRRPYSQPNAVCMWCTDHYDPKTMWCYLKKMRVLEPLLPHRCRGYSGVVVTVDSLKYLAQFRNKQLRLDV